MDEHRKARRRHSAQFKSEVLAACGEPGASIAGVALAFGLNANLVRQWQRGRGCTAGVAVAVPIAASQPQKFLPLALPGKPEAGSPAPDICVEVRRGALLVSVKWPQAAATECAGWLRELLR